LIFSPSLDCSSVTTIKTATSAYMYFSKHHRNLLKQENTDLSFGDLGKTVGAMWKAATPEEKQPFEEQAAIDKSRYLKQVGLFKKEAAVLEDEAKKLKVSTSSPSSSSSSSSSSSTAVPGSGGAKRETDEALEDLVLDEDVFEEEEVLRTDDSLTNSSMFSSLPTATTSTTSTTNNNNLGPVGGSKVGMVTSIMGGGGDMSGNHLLNRNQAFTLQMQHRMSSMDASQTPLAAMPTLLPVPIPPQHTAALPSPQAQQQPHHQPPSAT
jgi:hypothetical protein